MLNPGYEAVNCRIFVNIYEQINGVAYDHNYKEQKGSARGQDSIFPQRDLNLPCKLLLKASSFERLSNTSFFFLDVLFSEVGNHESRLW
ncbi:hypothetical protein TNIN_162521 [Trichonephila inaurata madagascariensis]|uniref:Uncharacterized protein n=1 Tax=Trichonephila inaurata madagascariensis TaxID=2747483 RepID=A0A8X7C8N3_9ARAC|nr:hypothetical protein TNIN_162521 [Trichonephila inaurata madagascariensis]